MKKFDEDPSPPSTNPQVQAIQILSQLHRLPEHLPAKAAILKNLALGEGDLVESLDYLMQDAIDHDWLIDCGCCDRYHRPDFHGDCRNDDERFPGW